MILSTSIGGGFFICSSWLLGISRSVLMHLVGNWLLQRFNGCCYFVFLRPVQTGWGRRVFWGWRFWHSQKKNLVIHSPCLIGFMIELICLTGSIATLGARSDLPLWHLVPDLVFVYIRVSFSWIGTRKSHNSLDPGKLGGFWGILYIKIGNF